MTIRLDQILLQHLKESLQPLIGLSSQDGLAVLLEATSWDGNAIGLTDQTHFSTVVQQLSDALDSVQTLLEKDQIEITDLVQGLIPIAEAIGQTSNLLSSLTLSPALPPDTLKTLAKDIFDFLIDFHFASRYPKLSFVLEFLGIFSVIEIPEIQDSNANVVRAKTLRRQLNLDALSKVVQDPLAYIRERYLNDSGGTQRLADSIADLIGPDLAYGLRQLGLSAGYGYTTDDLAADEAALAARMLTVDAPLFTGADNVWTLLRLVLTLSDETNGLGVRATFSNDIVLSINTSEGQITGEFSGGTSPILITKDGVTLSESGEVAQFKADVTFQTDASVTPAVRFGNADGTRFEIGELKIGASLSSDTHGVDVAASIDAKNMLLAIGGGNQDGFVSSVLPAKPIEIRGDLGLEASIRNGVRFRGNGGLQTTLPVNLEIGPLDIQAIVIAVDLASGHLTLELGATIAGALGPVTAVIENMGLQAALTSSSSGGNLGGLQLAIGFKSPSGVGLSVDTAGVSGGGFLRHDDANHEYAGTLQLEFTDLTLQAFGLITTQVAGGKGYALLALIDADFPPVQLGWGFTLNGVGGLLALHRTASIDALHSALKADKLSNILFPKNAITNASQILAELDALFPTAPGRFLFGPMALIGWGTPTVLTVALAVVIELPEPVRILLLARLAVRLPSESNSLVRINMDALGVLDLGQDTLSLDATLFDSRLLSYVLSGDMALRANWSGPSREFLLSVGGFHPRFTPPPGFPALKRMSIDMTAGSIATLHLESYLAITSNTFQIGASLHVVVKVSAFSIDGHLGFDALFQRNPFHFDGDISGSVAVSIDGYDLLSVSLDATLTGPAPWNIAGNFKVHIVFFDVHKSFAKTWGDDAPAEQIAAVDVGALLAATFADSRSWGAQLPAGTPALVTARDIQNAGTVVAHPLALLEAHERSVPLGIDIVRFGGAPLTGTNNFTITGFHIGEGGKQIPRENIQDDFAPAEFLDMSDDDKLAQPSFERHDAGVRLKGGLVASGTPSTKKITYETFFIDETNGQPRTDSGAPPQPWVLGDLQAVLSIGAAARATVMRAGNRRYTAPGNPINVAPPAFVLVDSETLAPVGVGSPGGATYSEVHSLLQQEINRDPAQQGHLQIVATHEMVPSHA